MNSIGKVENKCLTNPILKANFLSKWFFVWTRDIFRKGRRKQLDASELYAPLTSLDSQKLTEELEPQWQREKLCENPNLLHMIFRTYGWHFVPICVIYSALEITIHSFQPIFLGGLISYFAEDQTNITKQSAYLYAMGIVLCSLIGSICFHPFMFNVFKVGTRIRLACAGLVYRKCQRASVTADNSGMSSFAISILSTDLPQFDLTFYFFHDLWKGPIEACIFGYIMYTEIGWPAIMGIAFIVIFIPIQAWAAKAAAHFRQRSAMFGDERVKLMNEIITAIQVIKMYAWEKSFAKLIASTREREVQAIRGSMNIYAALQCTVLISKVALFLSLIAYVYTGDVVTAKKVFILSSYYNLLNDSLLHFWPLAITTWAQTVVCSRRILKFLMQSELPTSDGVEGGGGRGGVQNYCVDDDTKFAKIGYSHNPECKQVSLHINQLTAIWDKTKEGTMHQPHLHKINLNILSPNQFVGIVGNVGSSKSTLLNAILGELTIVNGHIEVMGRLSYAPQEPWIFQASIKENIVFVSPFDKERYKAVVHACQLDRDIQLFPQGDATIVGERGISLSGGQKARISLARAVYREADIYLFDDPLSAVDLHVGKLLMEKCFLKLLHDKMRILVTHHVQLLKKVDHLVLLESGKVTRQGTYKELKDSISLQTSTEEFGEQKMLLNRELSLLDKTKAEHGDTALASEESADDRIERQMQGSVRYTTYLAYFRALGAPILVFIVFTLFLVARGCQATMDIFISKWATFEENKVIDNDEFEAIRSHMLTLYSILIACTLGLYLVRTFGFFAMCLRISLHLHDMLFRGIICAYISFFNTNPSGRILNRFSSDITNVDVTLPQAMMDSLQFFVDALAILIIVAIANYWLLIPAALMVLLLYLMRNIYLSASRSLKRIESLTRSPIYSHTNQTFQGLTTIRALQAEQQLEDEFHFYQNTNTSALFLYVSVNRAFSFWTDLICVLYILAVTFSFLLIDGTFYSGDVGLAITQSMSLVIMCQWGMRQTAEMENNMTSVERILEYAQTPSEPQLETKADMKLAADWPNVGQIRFIDLCLRYSEKEDFILKGLSFETQPMEKLGIVGRTGAGKSSIIQAIFRLAINEGLIEIDGIDIANIGLHDLRSSIAIIPQDPILFSGTVRFNLDPFEQNNDEELWEALSDVKLKEYISTLDGCLSYCLQDGGTNFSMGQRQLMCLARAILRRNKILIMDEATANVDSGTDELIQDTIRRQFQHCTVITIAHRLHTIMDSDKVLVMDAGQIVEFGHPHELLQMQKGRLFKLVQQNDAYTANKLHAIAEENFLRKI